jgi:RNA polymerase sigma-70 factor, ECF subfamily
VSTLLTHAIPAQTMRDARSTSQHDFDTLYAVSCQRLTLQLYAYLGDLDDASRAVEEAFCRAYGKWASIQRHHEPLAWVRRTAWAIASRSERRRPVRTDDRMIAALATLPAPERRVVVLRFLAKLSIAEIAAHDGIDDTTVNARLARGKAALALALEGNV